MEPINYSRDVLSPVQGFLQGIKFGEGILTDRQGREATALGMDETRQVMGLRDVQDARAAEMAALGMDETRQQAAANAMQESLGALRQKAMDGTLSAEDINQFGIANASTFGDLKEIYEAQAQPKKDADRQTTMQIASGLLRGNTDAALSIIDERIAAAENSGLADEANKFKAIRAQIEMDPLGYATGSLASAVALGAIDGATMKAILDASGQGAAEGASPLGKIAQDVESGLLPKSVLDAGIRVEEKSGTEGLTLQQRISEEARLRGEYSKRTEDLSSAERNFDIIQTSAEDNSGAGDIALVTAFMKMLDPGSVVRETEFATAANSGGLLSRLSSIAKKVESGQFLTPQQRTDFKRLAGQYLRAAKEQETRVQSSYQQIVDNYGLDPINVFGSRAVPDAPPDAPPAAGRTRYDAQGSRIP